MINGYTEVHMTPGLRRYWSCCPALLLHLISSFYQKTAMSQVMVRIFGSVVHGRLTRNGTRNGSSNSGPSRTLVLHTLDK